MSTHPVARRVFAAMAERGIDKAALWRALDSTHQTVSKWEVGAVPGGDLLAKLPEILKVSGHWLLTGEGPIEPPGEVPDAGRLQRVAAAAERGAILRVLRGALDSLEGITPPVADRMPDDAEAAARAALAPGVLKATAPAKSQRRSR